MKVNGSCFRNEAEKAALEEAGRRIDYETGVVGMKARRALSDELIRAHVEYVQAGRNMGEVPDPEVRRKAVKLDLSVWCDSDLEQHQVFLEVLMDRDRSDGRNAEMRRDDWVQRVPVMNRKWKIADGVAGGEAGMMPAQFPWLVLKGV